MAKIWQLNLIATITIQVSALQNRKGGGAQKSLTALQKVKSYLCASWSKKLSDPSISTQQIWTSIKTLQEKRKNDPFHVTAGYGLWKFAKILVKIRCAWADRISRNFNLQMAVSYEDQKCLALSHVLSHSVTNFSQGRYQNLRVFLYLQRNT